MLAPFSLMNPLTNFQFHHLLANSASKDQMLNWGSCSFLFVHMLYVLLDIQNFINAVGMNEDQKYSEGVLVGSLWFYEGVFFFNHQNFL